MVINIYKKEIFVATKTTASKNAKTGKSKSTKADKATAKAPTKPKNTTTKTASSKAQSSSSKSTKSNKSEKKGTGRMIAWILGGIAAIAIIVVAIVAIANKLGDSLTVKTGKGDQIETQYTDFNNGGFRLKIPTSFKTLSEDEIKKKYGSSDAPRTVYASQDDKVNIAISPSDSTLSNDQIETYLNTMKSLLGIGGEILDTKYYSQGNHNLGAVQLVTEDDNTKYYNHMVFFSQDNKLVVLTFNCPDADRDEWQPVGDFVMKSLDIKK